MLDDGVVVVDILVNDVGRAVGRLLRFESNGRVLRCETSKGFSFDGAEKEKLPNVTGCASVDGGTEKENGAKLPQTTCCTSVDGSAENEKGA